MGIDVTSGLKQTIVDGTFYLIQAKESLNPLSKFTRLIKLVTLS